MNLYCCLAFFAGWLVTMQAAINGQLRAALGSPPYATMVSLIVSIVVAGLYCAVTRQSLPDFGSLSQTPWWIWTGGIVGVVYIYLALLLTANLSAAELIATIVSGQLICALILDHFALLGFASHPINWMRIAGVVLLIAGVVVIHRS